MKVEIWSDVVCPWCYIGKRRMESALAQFKHREQVEIIWRSYQLDPDAPQHSEETVNQHLAKKYGGGSEQVEKMIRQVSTIADQEGLEYHLEKARHSNTFDAHRLIHLAAIHNLQDEVKERLLKAYFTEGASIGEHETLVRVVTETGIDAEEARAVLASDAYADEVKADIKRARMFGIRGVPFFAINEKYGVSGAQPAEALLEVLEQAWSEEHPLIHVGTNSSQGGLCDDGTCEIPQN